MSLLVVPDGAIGYSEIWDKFVTLCAQTSQRQVADRFGFTISYINDIVHKRRQLSDAIATKMGYEKTVITYYTRTPL